MRTTKGTPYTPGKLYRHGKELKNYLAVYESIRSGRQDLTPEGKKALQTLIISKCSEILNAVSE